MKKLVAFLVLALAALALVACGGGSDDSSTTATSGGEGAAIEAGEKPNGAPVLKFEADPDNAPDSTGHLAFTSTEETAKAGKVTIEFVNPTMLTHDVLIESANGKEVAKTGLIYDGTFTMNTELEPGTYTYYCSIPGHREAGMEGTLTVQ
jgi:plastocyanin